MTNESTLQRIIDNPEDYSNKFQVQELATELWRIRNTIHGCSVSSIDYYGSERSTMDMLLSLILREEKAQAELTALRAENQRLREACAIKDKALRSARQFMQPAILAAVDLPDFDWTKHVDVVEIDAALAAHEQK